MYQILSTAATRRVEDLSEEHGLTRKMLMDTAGHQVACLAEEMAPAGEVVIFCGKGNNAGDGWVAARYLVLNRRDVRLISSCDPAELTGIAQDAAGAAITAGVFWQASPEFADIEVALAGAALVIDGMFGAGFHGILGQPFASWVDAIEEGDTPVLAIDIPTGLSGDLGVIGGRALHARTTLATIAVKPGMIGGVGREYCGRIVCTDLGIETLQSGAIASEACAVSWSPGQYRNLIPLPAPDTYKYSRGCVGVVAGSASYTGAAVLCASGAGRGGAGYVRLAVPEPTVSVMQAHLASVPVVGFPADETGAFSPNTPDTLCERLASCDALVCGPGITITPGTRALVRTLIMTTKAPLLLDADALSIVSEEGDILAKRSEKGRVTVITPHQGEMSRLLRGLGEPPLGKGATPEERIAAGRSLARLSGAIVVLKGPATLIIDGEQVVMSGFGSPALATAGTGDVLSGIIGALLAQGLQARDAAALGVYLHSRAGLIASEKRSELCVIAEDVVDALGDAVMETLALEEK